MLITILRHADAEPHCVDDAARRLTEKGYKQAKRVGCFMKEQGIRPDIILTSPAVRARETAEIVGKILANQNLTEVPWASSGMDPMRALDELAAYSRFKSVLLVGHEPDLSCLIATLLGLGKSISVSVPKASLTSIEVPRLGVGAGTLQFLLPVKFL